MTSRRTPLLSSFKFYGLLTPFLLFFAFPLYWLIVTAFKPTNDILAWPPVWFPQQVTLDNFVGNVPESIQIGLTSTDAPRFFVNSVAVGLVSMALATFVLGPAAAYAIARYRVGGRGLPIWVMSVRAVPLLGIAIPYLLLFRDLGILDTWWALVIVHLVISTAFATFMLIGFFNDIPREIDEAALIDGHSRFGAFFRIVFPLARPGLVATAILTFITSWNHFVSALLYANTARAQTVPVFIASLRVQEYPTAWGVLAASGLVAIIPTLVFTAFVLRYLARGLTMGAVKG